MALTLSRAAVARTLPYAAYTALIALRGWWADADAHWVDAAIALIVAGVLAWNWREYAELVRQTWPTSTEIGIALALGVALGAASTQLGGFLIGGPRTGYLPVDAAGASSVPAMAVQGATMALLVPLMDELFWRSFLMRWLQRPQFEAVVPQRVGPKAIVLATFVYTLAHPHWLAAALAGAVCAVLYVRTGKLWVPVVAHAAANGVLAVWVVGTGSWSLW